MEKHHIDCTKAFLFTDIHYGAADADKVKGLRHNQDNDAFIDFCITEIQADSEIDSIFFLGDWNQHRTAINLHTLKFAYEGMKKLNELDLPIYIILGNHDLYKKNDRSIHSLHFFEQFENVVLIRDPMILEQKNKKYQDVLMVPFLMHGEEKDLIPHLKVPVWFGHFEFDGYEVTGYGMEMHGGINPDDFKKPKLIVSGHFHKRQSKKNKNIVYMGNPFPTNFGDAGDENRGYATYDFRSKKIKFTNWEDGPLFVKTTLSKILEGEVEINERCYVKCIVDMPMTYEESAATQKAIMQDYNPRDFSLEESIEFSEIITETEASKKWANDEMATVDEMVVEMLTDVESDSLNNDILVAIYNGLKDA